jgi:hypothetical protein
MKQILLLILLFPFVSHAGDPLNACGQSKADPASWKDLRKPGQSMHGIPVLDQDGQHFCYAYSGSVQAAAWLNLNASPLLTKEERSALVLSPFAQGVAARISQTHQCTHPCDVVNYAFEKGACSSDSVIFASDAARPLDRPDVVMENCVRWEKPGVATNYMRYIEEILEDYRKDQAKSSSYEAMTKEFEYFFAHTKFHHLSELEKKKLIDFALSNPKLDWRTYLAVMAPRCYRFSADSKTPEFTGNIDMKKVFGVQTDAELEKKKPVCTYSNGLSSDSCKTNQATAFLSPEEYIKQINTAFDQDKPMPVGIDYCWNFLMDGPDAPNEQQLKACKRKGQDKLEDDHKSVLIGRRVNPSTKKCEYLLRNSWGNDCNSYHGSGSESEHETYYNSCQDELAKNGAADVWIEASVLAPNLHGYQNLKSKDAK